MVSVSLVDLLQLGHVGKGADVPVFAKPPHWFLFTDPDRFWPNVTMPQYVKSNEFALAGVVINRYLVVKRTVCCVAVRIWCGESEP